MYRLSEIPLGLSTFTGSRTFVQDLKDMGQMSLPVRAVRNRAQCAKQKGGCQANAHSWGRVGSRFARQALLKPGSQPEKQDGLKLACHARWPNACCNPAACQAKHLSSSVHLLPTCMAPKSASVRQSVRPVPTSNSAWHAIARQICTLSQSVYVRHATQTVLQPIANA